MARKRKPGKRVYYKVRSKNPKQTRKEAVQEYVHRAKFFGPEQAKAREARDTKYANMIRSGLLNDKIDPTEYDFGGDRRLEVERAIEFIERLDNMERHIVVFQGLRRIRILFYNKEATRWWFVERNKLTGAIRKSIDYGSREQAFDYHVTETILFVE